jgi:hypothetical protein
MRDTKIENYAERRFNTPLVNISHAISKRHNDNERNFYHAQILYFLLMNGLMQQASSLLASSKLINRECCLKMALNHLQRGAIMFMIKNCSVDERISVLVKSPPEKLSSFQLLYRSVEMNNAVKNMVFFKLYSNDKYIMHMRFMFDEGFDAQTKPPEAKENIHKAGMKSYLCNAIESRRWEVVSMLLKYGAPLINCIIDLLFDNRIGQILKAIELCPIIERDYIAARVLRFAVLHSNYIHNNDVYGLLIEHLLAYDDALRFINAGILIEEPECIVKRFIEAGMNVQELINEYGEEVPEWLLELSENI